MLAHLRRFRPVALVLAVFGAFGAVRSVPATSPAAAKPNIVVIMTDDETVEQMKVMPLTRSLIGDAGATFDVSFSSFPLCCPSRSTFLTGQYAHNHGVLENEEPTGGYYRLKSENTLPVWLRKAGYRTIHVGKYLNDYGTKDPREVPPGWDEWHGLTDPGTYQMWGYQMNDNGALTTYGSFEVEDPATYQTDVLRQKAVEQIGAAAGGGKPFFMTLWFLAPHREVASLSAQTAPRPAPRHRNAFANEPLPKPPSFNEKDMSDKALFMRIKPRLNAADIATITNQYRRELETLLAVDETVAAVVSALQSSGVLGNTYVIFTSDNGYFHGEHRTPDEKILGYENSARVPLLIRGPGIAAGSHVRELVANVDLAPTIAAWAGATPGLEMDGRSLIPFIADPSKRTRRPILLEAFWPLGSTLGFFTEQIPASGVFSRPEGTSSAAGPSLPLPLGKTIMPYEAVRTDRYVYIEYLTGEHELYDLAEDPWQISSKHLDPAYLATQVALAQALTKLRLCRGAACRAQTPVIPDPL
jgi:arylsulfatase A-like enzyme